MRPTCKTKWRRVKVWVIRLRLQPAILENADDEKEVEEINDSEIVSFCDKYSTLSGKCSTDIHSSESEEEKPKSCL